MNLTLRRCIGVWLGLEEYLSFLPGSHLVTTRCSSLVRPFLSPTTKKNKNKTIFWCDIFFPSVRQTCDPTMRGEAVIGHVVRWALIPAACPAQSTDYLPSRSLPSRGSLSHVPLCPCMPLRPRRRLLSLPVALVLSSHSPNESPSGEAEPECRSLLSLTIGPAPSSSGSPSALSAR
jgi:hypothetical protein